MKAVLQGGGSDSVFWSGEKTQSLADFKLFGPEASLEVSGNGPTGTLLSAKLHVKCRLHETQELPFKMATPM